MIKEEVNIAANVENGKIDINDSAVRDTVNSMIEGVTAHCFLTPYIALERVSKVLANFHIYLPKYTFMEGDSGLATFPVHQFGEKVGMTNDGQVITKATSPYTLWFEYQMNDQGKYEVFCSVVDGDELRDLMSDLNDDSEELEEAVVRPETGPRKVPGSATDTCAEMEEDDQTSPNMSELLKAIIRRTMKPGVKFAGDEAGGKQKPETSLSESKKKSLAKLDENVPSAALGEKPKPAQWNLDEDGESIVPKTSSTRQPSQSEREMGTEKLMQAFAAQDRQSQDKMQNTIDRLKLQDYASKAAGEKANPVTMKYPSGGQKT